MLDGEILERHILCAAGQVVVEAEQHQLGHRRAAGVQIAQIVMDGAQLVARKIERARLASQIPAGADGVHHGAEAAGAALGAVTQDAQAVGQAIERAEEPRELGGILALSKPPQHHRRHPVAVPLQPAEIGQAATRFWANAPILRVAT